MNARRRRPGWPAGLVRALLPMRELTTRFAELPRDRTELLTCNTQSRSSATFDALRARLDQTSSRAWRHARMESPQTDDGRADPLTVTTVP